MRYITGIIALMVAFAAGLAADPPSRVGRLNYVQGPVSFQPAGIDQWVDATVNRPLITGDDLWVDNGGRAEVHVGSTALRLDQDTALQFLALDDRTVQLSVSEGTLTVRMRNLAPGQIFELDTPNLAFSLQRPGEYRVNVSPDGQSTIIAVRDGEGELTGGGQDFLVEAGQRVNVVGSNPINYSFSSLPAPDPWDQWTYGRDRREDQAVSVRYVSSEVPGYEDLDQYGRWESDPGYGMVWAPTAVASGWAPYHEGHWAWIAPWGWTWVDDEPWGFAPYHYGRWAFLRSHWCWVPGPSGVAPVYAPALVAWVGGDSGFSFGFSFGSAPAIGWFALGPREPYFPTYEASESYFARVNTTNTVISSTVINNYYASSRNPRSAAIANLRYMNQGQPSAVAAMPRNNFAAGRAQDVRTVPPTQLASTHVSVAPAIVPQRESVLGPKAATASRAARPPAPVLSRAVVARTAPPPPPVPFDRQAPQLSKNPGHPLASNEIQAMRPSATARSHPVQVMDMSRVQHIQPKNGPSNAPAPPAVSERQNVPPGRGNRQAQPPQPQAVPAPPAVSERQNVPPGRGNRQAQPPQPQAAPAPPAVSERQNVPPGRGNRQAQPPQPQTAPAPPAVSERQNVPPGRGNRQAEPPQPQAAPAPPAVSERQNVPPGQERRQAQPAQPQAPPAPSARQNAPPPQERRQAQPAPPQAAPAPPAVSERQNVPPGQERRQAQPAQPQAPPAPSARQSAPPPQERRQAQPPQAAPPAPVESTRQNAPPPQEKRQAEPAQPHAAPPPPAPNARQSAPPPQEKPQAPQQNQGLRPQAPPPESGKAAPQPAPEESKGKGAEKDKTDK